MMKTTIESVMNPAAPPGTFAIVSASVWENPDWVIAQAIAVAVPTMKRIEPDNDTVSTSIGQTRRHSNWR